MFKKLLVLVMVGFIAVSLCGCIALMLFMADSAQTKQTLPIPYSQALDVVKGSFKTLGIQFESVDIRQDIAEAKGRYADGRTVRILISKVSDNESSIAVRAGLTEIGKEEADKILKAIIDYYEQHK